MHDSRHYDVRIYDDVGHVPGRHCHRQRCYGMIPQSISRSKLFIMLQLIIPLSVILTIPLFEKLPLVYLMLDVRWGGSWAHMQWLRFLLAASVMFVPTVAMGALLPTVSSIFIEKTGHLGARLGQAYGFNTLGNVIGAVAAGLLLIPAVGMQNTIMLGAVLNLIAGFGIYMMESSVSFKRRIAGVMPAGSIAVLLLCMVQPWSPKIMSSGVYVYAGRYHETQERYQKAARLSNDVAEMSSWRIWEAAMGVDELLYYNPGITATVAVMESKEGVRFLTVDGKTDASTGGRATCAPRSRSANCRCCFTPIPIRFWWSAWAAV